MEDKKDNCLCGAGEYIVMACSGASDVGQISDLVARKLRENGVRKMNCLAVVGAGIEKSIENFKTKEILIIDGCPIDCGKRMMEQHNFTNYKYLRVTDLGLVKGKIPVTEENIQKVYEKAELIF
ncbi:MAG: putative zinc-binding protein [Bacteroidales bacterium]|nr:putative zinc-binding protein [Bacteroidales bacterium]